MFDVISSSIEHIGAGSLRALAVTTASLQRLHAPEEDRRHPLQVPRPCRSGSGAVPAQAALTLILVGQSRHGLADTHSSCA
jgi:hypothetical protein